MVVHELAKLVRRIGDENARSSIRQIAAQSPGRGVAEAADQRERKQ